MKTVLKEVRDEVAAILGDGLLVSEVEDAMMGAYGFTAECIADDTFKPVRMQYIGEWSIKDYNQKKILQRRHEKQQQLLDGRDTELPSKEP